MSLVEKIASEFLQKRANPYVQLMRAREPEEVMAIMRRSGLMKKMEEILEELKRDTIPGELSTSGGWRHRDDNEGVIDIDWSVDKVKDFPAPPKIEPVFRNDRLDSFNVEGTALVELAVSVGESLVSEGLERLSDDEFEDQRNSHFNVPFPSTLFPSFGEDSKARLLDLFKKDWAAKDFPLLRVVSAEPNQHVDLRDEVFENAAYGNWIHVHWTVVVEIEWDFNIDLAELGLRPFDEEI